MDTRKDVGGAPLQTFFRLPQYFTYTVVRDLLFERGMHNPSPAESLAPFHQDPAQRIIVLCTQHTQNHFVLRVGALLELLKDREGTEIPWDQWKRHVVLPSLRSFGPGSRGGTVSGCRLFHISANVTAREGEMRVYDFSIRGRAEYLSELTIDGIGTIKKLASTGAEAQVPMKRFFGLQSTHGSIVFPLVSATFLCSLWGEANWNIPCFCSATS